jgi:hypothetical protein
MKFAVETSIVVGYTLGSREEWILITKNTKF